MIASVFKHGVQTFYSLVTLFLDDKLVGGVSYTVGADKRLGFLIGTKLEKFNLYYSYNTSSNLFQDYNNSSQELMIGMNFGCDKKM